jgi:hypothetical protein
VAAIHYVNERSTGKHASDLGAGSRGYYWPYRVYRYCGFYRTYWNRSNRTYW